MPPSATVVSKDIAVTPAKIKEQELHDKYRKLKRRFFELEERHKETSSELQRSGQRNTQMQEERSMLLERITELESQPGFVPPSNSGSHSPGPQSNDTESSSSSSQLPSRRTRAAQGRDAAYSTTTRSRAADQSEDASEGDPDLDGTESSDDADDGSGAYGSSRTRRAKRPRDYADPDSDAPDVKSPRPPPPRPSYNPYQMLAPSGGLPPIYPYMNPYAYWPMPGMPYLPPPQMIPPQPQASTSQQRPLTEAPRPAKPKRLKAHTVTSKSYNIPMVPRDKLGKPMLPLNVGIMTVISLGDVCMREHFHTERYIFPVGYEVTRRYLSTVDRNAEVVYHCTILDGGDGPKFQIIPSDVPDRPVIAGTATGAWSSIVKQANALRQRQHSNSVSGPDFFGLGQNTIKHLIQGLPNADRLRDYVWQHFVEGGPLGGRHAAVIPALPEEYKSTTPLGSYYPQRLDDPDGEGHAHVPPPHLQHPRVDHYPQVTPPTTPSIQQQQPQPKYNHYPPHLQPGVANSAAGSSKRPPDP
uniref:Transforming growth factor beta regulator 1 n=1 Tax=Mycena chlorophos TaxID=658473 RepID=A0ABQ0L0X3_MYCCL|nr:predicted protein [Mycena chlorophos]